MNPKIALIVMSCLHGTLHGQPHDSCMEHIIRSYDNDDRGNGVLACTRAAPAAVADMIKGLHEVQIDVFVPDFGGWRCVPYQPGGDDD